MKFDLTKTYFAILSFANTIDDIGDNPAHSSTLFSNLCDYLKLKKHEIQRFKVNLLFAWSNNRNKFRDKIIKALESKKNQTQSDNNDETTLEDLPPDLKHDSTTSADDLNDSQQLIRQLSHQLSTSSISSFENEDEDNSSTKYDYTYLGTLNISIVDIVNDNIICSNLPHDKLRKLLPPKFDVTCFCIFNGFVRCKNDKFRDYAHCGQPGCPIKFKFHGVSIGLTVQVKIFSSSGKNKPPTFLSV